MLQKYGALSRRAHPAHRSRQLLHAGRAGSYDFYTELGFRLTEYTETEGADPKLWAVWMQRRGNMHDLAFTNGRGPRLHHIGVWVPNALDILHTCDVMATSGYLANMERGPGRHGIANAFFLYVRDPDGHRVELFTSDYLTVDPDHEPIRWTLATRSGRRCGGIRRRSPGSRRARPSWACRCASRRSRRARWWRGREAYLRLPARGFAVAWQASVWRQLIDQVRQMLAQHREHLIARHAGLLRHGIDIVRTDRAREITRRESDLFGPLLTHERAASPCPFCSMSSSRLRSPPFSAPPAAAPPAAPPSRPPSIPPSPPGMACRVSHQAAQQVAQTAG